MDIRSGQKYPSGALSNFSPYKFIVDGVSCNSMEGFLQSLKFSSPDMQVYMCTLVGGMAKRKGAKKNWRPTQTLYWKGASIKRDSEQYQNLLDCAYESLSKNTKFAKALLASGKATLQHSIGRKKENETVLTVKEYCGRLHKIRDRLQDELCS